MIIDEIESVLNHFTSPHLEQKHKTARNTFNLLKNICAASSTKMLCMDADYNLRAFKFSENFGTSLLVHNVYNTQMKTFNMTRNKEYFLAQICADLNNGLKICIASMSSGDILGIENEILNTDIVNSIKCIV